MSQDPAKTQGAHYSAPWVFTIVRIIGRMIGKVNIGNKSQKALMDKLHDRIETYRDVELSEDSNMTLGEWLDRWVQEYAAHAVRPNTLSGYEQLIESYIKPRLGNERIMGEILPLKISCISASIT